MFDCERIGGCGLALLTAVQVLVPGLTCEAALRLEVQVDAMTELAVITTLATGFKLLWDSRVTNKRLYLYMLRSQLESQIITLRKSKYWRISDMTDLMVNSI